MSKSARPMRAGIILLFGLLSCMQACSDGSRSGGGGQSGDGLGDDDGNAGAAAASGEGGSGASSGASGTGSGEGGDSSSGSGGGAGDGAAGDGANEPDGGDDDSGTDPDPVTTPTPTDDELASASGCAGIFNPDQLLTLALEIEPGDWSKVLADTSYSVVVPAQMQCEDEPPLTVGVRRKRSGGQTKVGLKIDINAIVDGQEWYGLKKLSLENGVSEGTTEDGAEVRTYVAEYLAWRMMVLSGAISSRASLVALEVNGETIGVYVNVEQVDKRFLEARLGDDSGWLYKKSGGVDDGLKTHETTGDADNVYDDYFCFWKSGNSCLLPSESDLLAELPGHLDIPQFLRFGAANAFIANTDGPLFKDNNYYYYDYASGPRVYLPWDLDTAMKDSPSIYMGGGGGGGTSDFDAVLFTHWREDYTAIVQELLATKLTQSVIEGELDRVLDVATARFDADPYVSGTTEQAVESLKEYWVSRLAAIQAELP